LLVTVQHTRASLEKRHQPGHPALSVSLSQFVPDDKCRPECFPSFRQEGLLNQAARMSPITELSSNIAYEFRVAAVGLSAVAYRVAPHTSHDHACLSVSRYAAQYLQALTQRPR
jgi:hypothetical protein